MCQHGPEEVAAYIRRGAAVSDDTKVIEIQPEPVEPVKVPPCDL